MLVCQLLTNSCFNPSSTNYVEVSSETTEPNIVIDFNVIGDTIKINHDCAVKFTYSIGDNKLNWVKVFIDTTEYTTSDIGNHTFSFNISRSTLKPGIHNIDIIIFTNSNTGSLADHLKVEGYLAESKWILLFK
jgi:hypothetical protein